MASCSCRAYVYAGGRLEGRKKKGGRQTPALVFPLSLPSRSCSFYYSNSSSFSFTSLYRHRNIQLGKNQVLAMSVMRDGS